MSRRKQQARGGNRLFIRIGFAQMLEFRFLFTVKIRGGGDKDSGKGESKHLHDNMLDYCDKSHYRIYLKLRMEIAVSKTCGDLTRCTVSSPTSLKRMSPFGGPAGSRLLAGVQLPELGVVDRGEVLVDREHELPGPGRRVAGSLLLSRQAGRMLLFPSEDDGPDVTVKEPCDDWLVLTLRAWKDVSRLEYLFTGGHIRQQLIVYSTTEYGEKGFLVDCPHHAEVVRLLLLAQRDTKDACAP